jgi:hypothetical protein
MRKTEAAPLCPTTAVSPEIAAALPNVVLVGLLHSVTGPQAFVPPTLREKKHAEPFPKSGGEPATITSPLMATEVPKFLTRPTSGETSHAESPHVAGPPWFLPYTNTPPPAAVSVPGMTGV